jgi:hypothetical protein
MKSRGGLEKVKRNDADEEYHDSSLTVKGS